LKHSPVKYLFADNDLAAQRLKELAEVFAPSTRAFVQESIQNPPRRLLDLGCGPGITTHFLAELTACQQAIGLDKSANFLAQANETETGQVRFRRHDLTVTPFPTLPADFAYARYVLTHLNDPPGIIERWSMQLQPGGKLLVEEVEWIRSEVALFSTYLEIVARMLADQGNQLYLGPSLDGIGNTHSLRCVSSQVRQLAVPNHRAAMLFYLNIQSWKHNNYVRANYGAGEIAALQASLGDLATNETDACGIEWGLRQIVFEKVVT
jgi:ubiquinone/menaquinone biosynthesis C-methylase UbiE